MTEGSASSVTAAASVPGSDVLEVLGLEPFEMELLVPQGLYLLLQLYVGCDEEFVVLKALLAVLHDSLDLLHEEIVVLHFLLVEL